jgi:hypothetical protein
VVKANQGTGFRHGICPQTCIDVYHACKDSLFFYNHGSTRAQLTVCKKDSLICSKLEHIAPSHQLACELLGLNINPKTEIDQDFMMKIMRNIRVSEQEVKEHAVCHNLSSSYHLYGKSPVKHTVTSSEKGHITALEFLLLISTLVVFLVV